MCDRCQHLGSGKATELVADDVALLVQDEGELLMTENIAFSFSLRCHVMVYGYFDPYL
jgi:hypothetical protein